MLGEVPIAVHAYSVPFSASGFIRKTGAAVVVDVVCVVDVVVVIVVSVALNL